MEINFENIETICRICLQCKQSNSLPLQHEMEINSEIYEFSSIYSAITVYSRTVSLIDIMTMCLSHKLSDDKIFPQMICSVCVQRLSDCCELKFQIEQSEQLLLNVVSNRLFMGLSSEYSESSDQHVNKSNSIIDTIHAVVNDFETSYAGNEIIVAKSVQDEVQEVQEVQEVVAEIEATEHQSEKCSTKSTLNCTICSKKFSTTTKLDRHLVNQHVVRNDRNIHKPHQCDECNKSYTTKSNLVLHRAVHSGIKPFICEICNRGFYKKTSLSTHMSIHTGIRKHLCTVCGRSFTSANILQQHKRTHSDVRRFICSVCSKGFHTSNDLRVHFRSHSGEKPFLCCHCGRRFSRVTHLNIHFRTHSGEKPFACQQCPKAFAQSGDLKAHERIHNGSKPYECKICDKRFNQSSGLSSHMKSHTNERNYVCFCGKSFTQSSSLARHGKLHRKNTEQEMNDNASINKLNENQKTVLCVGMCVLDIVHVCDQFPIEDQDKRSKHGRWQRGGNASNNCTVLSQLGMKCEFFGPLTDLKMFEFVIDDMANRNIDYKHCVYHNCEAPISSILLNAATGSRTIIHSNPNMPYVTYEDFKSLNLSDYGWINFEGRRHEETFKMMESVVAFNKDKDKSDRITISLDLEKLQIENLSLVDFADVVILSKEFAMHLGCDNKTTAVHSFRQLKRSRNIIICPWGTDGVAALDSDDNLFTAEAYPPDIVVDSLGAGDTFSAGIIYALQQNDSVNSAILFASRLAGMKVGFFGYDRIRENCANLLHDLSS